MINKALQEIIDNIYADKEDLARRIAAENDEYRKHDLQFEYDSVIIDRFRNIYHRTLASIPDGDLEYIEGTIINVLGSEEAYDRLKGNVLTHFPKATLRKFCESVPISIIAQHFDTLIDKLSEHVSNKDMDQIAKETKNYIPSPINNTPIHPLKDKIESIKKGEKFAKLGAKEREEVAKQLDGINEVVKESPRRYSDSITDFDADYERITNTHNRQFFANYIKENEGFAKAFERNDLSFTIKDDVAGDKEKVDIVKSQNFKLTPQTQSAILRIWKKMDELNIISAGNGAESGSKIYGFAKIYGARENINKALKNEQFDNLKTLREEYEKQLQNMREMYRLVKTELNPTPETIPGNVQNYREDFVPAEFKNDICVNATVNGMYNAYSIVKSMGISAEEFLQNPQPYIEQAFNAELNKFHIDKYYKNVPFEETVARVYGDKSKAGLNAHGMPRMVSTLTLFEKDKDQRVKDMIYGAIQTGKIENIYADEQVCYNYFSNGRTNSLVNLIFVNPEDRNFDKLRSTMALTGDKLHKLPAFDLASYLKEKNIPAEVIEGRIKNFLTTAYNLSQTSEKQHAKDQVNYDKLLQQYKEGKISQRPDYPGSQALSNDEFVKMVKDLQQGVLAYAMLSDSQKDPAVSHLVNFLRDPADALKSLNLDEKTVQKMDKLKSKDVVLNNYKEQAKLEGVLDTEDIRLKEATYNKLADKILKDANKLASKVAGEKDAKKVEELQKRSVQKMNELKQLQKAETERLCKEHKDGNIPSDYYKKRVENILSLNHNNKIAIFDEGLTKGSFIKSTGLEKLSRAEANALFECELAKQKTEKELFMNQQFLQKNGLISTNKDIQVLQGNFEQIDTNQIGLEQQENQREPLVVEEAKIESLDEKSQPQSEIAPRQTVKMP